MSSLTETSLTSMKAAFPAAPDPIQGIPKLASLIDLMLYMCCCLQTHKMPTSDKMNMWFCAASPGLYSFFTTEAYPTSFFLFPPEVDTFPDFFHLHLWQWAQDPESNELSWQKNSSRHHHHECRPLQRFPCKSTKSNLWDVQAYLHETAKHCFPTHVWLVHQQIRRNNDQRLWRKLTENGRQLASLRWFWAPCNAPLCWCSLRECGTLPNERLQCHWHWTTCNQMVWNVLRGV